MSISLTLVPHSPNLGSLYGCAIGTGLGCGVLNTIINVWIIEMWKEKSPSVLQIPGLMFGVGTILSPLIIKPFLRHKHNIDEHSINPDNVTAINTYSVNRTESGTGYDKDFEEERRDLLKTPFYILGAIQLICK